MSVNYPTSDFPKFDLQVTPYGQGSKIFLNGKELQHVKRIQLDVGAEQETALTVTFCAVSLDATGESCHLVEQSK